MAKVEADWLMVGNIIKNTFLIGDSYQGPKPEKTH